MSNSCDDLVLKRVEAPLMLSSISNKITPHAISDIMNDRKRKSFDSIEVKTQNDSMDSTKRTSFDSIEVNTQNDCV